MTDLAATGDDTISNHHTSLSSMRQLLVRKKLRTSRIFPYDELEEQCLTATPRDKMTEIWIDSMSNTSHDSEEPVDWDNSDISDGSYFSQDNDRPSHVIHDSSSQSCCSTPCSSSRSSLEDINYDIESWWSLTSHTLAEMFARNDYHAQRARKYRKDLSLSSDENSRVVHVLYTLPNQQISDHSPTQDNPSVESDLATQTMTSSDSSTHSSLFDIIDAEINIHVDNDSKNGNPPDTPTTRPSSFASHSSCEVSPLFTPAELQITGADKLRKTFHLQMKNMSYEDHLAYQAQRKAKVKAKWANLKASVDGMIDRAF